MTEWYFQRLVVHKQIWTWQSNGNFKSEIAKSTGTVEYTDYISAEG